MNELPYTTLKELKEHLPEVLTKITAYKELAKMALDMMKNIQHFVLLEIQLGVDYGYFTSDKHYAEQYCKYMDYTAKAMYWEKQVENLKW